MFTPNVLKTLDGGYATVLSKTNESSLDICLIKLDINFDTVWTRLYGEPGINENGYGLTQLF